MSGMVGVIANDSARFTLFGMALTGLQTPVNTTIEWAVGSDRSRGRNNIVKRALEFGAEWIFYVDDDHVFPGDHLLRLLDWEEDIVASLYVQRVAPFYPIAYGEIGDDGTYLPLHLPDLPAEGLVEVVGAGTGGMLVRAEVFHVLEETHGQEWFTHTTEKSEDLMFCDRAIAAGFKVHVDLGARLGHIAPAAVWPTHHGEAGWQIGWTFSESARFMAPIEERVLDSPVPE